MSERGEYRSIHRVLVHGPQFRALSPGAKLAFYTLRLELGPTGIDIYYLDNLHRLTGTSPELSERACAELRDAGWLDWDDNVVWLVSALEHEPSLAPSNGKHRTSVQSHLKGLPHLPVVDRFIARYAQWFDQPPAPPPTAPPPTPSDASRMATDSLSDAYRSTEREEGEGRGKGNTESSFSPAREPVAATSGATACEEANAFQADDTRAAVCEFLDALPAGTLRTRWLPEILGWLDGLNMPRGRPITEADVAAGLRDYLRLPAKDFGSAHVRSFVARAARDRERGERAPPELAIAGPPGRGGGGPHQPRLTAAARTAINARRAIEDL